MMRIQIIQFSGTGNTRRIAEILAGQFQAEGMECQVTPMEAFTLGDNKLDLSKWDLIGIGFPVHAMDAPQIVYDLLALLPNARQPYFLFKTAGSSFLQGGSTLGIRHRLADLGWMLRHEQLYVMPPNMFGTARDEKVAERYQACRELAIESAQEILSGVKQRVPDAPFRAACYAFARLEKQGAHNSSRYWTVNPSCIHCGLCASQCPTGNIAIKDGKPAFGNKCLICLRCWWNCPTRAISHRIFKPFFLKNPYKLPE